MAPKGKSPTPSKSLVDNRRRAMAGAGGEVAPPFKNLRLKILWVMIGIISFVCLIMLITMTYLYVSLGVDKQHPLEDQMKKMRHAMATGLKSPKLDYENQSLFRKGGRSAGGWQLFGKSLYYISKGEKSWYDAENFCLSRDAHLASIMNEEEQEFITSQLDEPAWIGLTDEHEEGAWEWTDGSTLLGEYWSEGKPSRARHYGEVEQDCAAIVPSVHGDNWSDADCHGRNRWVCKESLDARGG
ncbi:C-type lectin domain family 4 member F [Varanus komodoensis]|nr:C-type lectin domain family 4 member F [Varanus komodoensis]